MKMIMMIIAVLFSVTAASALESHYGKIYYQGGRYHCAYTNNGAAKDMKWVYFAVERRSGKERDVFAQYKVDKVVASGETITVSSDFDASYVGWYCKFLERNPR
jgi:hypothetical protein